MAKQTTTQSPLTGVDMGFNLQMARRKKKLTQYQLAELTGLKQTDISEMENQEIIENDVALTVLANELGVTLDAIKKIRLDDILNSRTVQYNDLHVVGANGSRDVVNQGSGHTIQQTFNYASPDLKEFYQSLLDEKDVRIKECKEDISELRAQLTSLIHKIS